MSASLGETRADAVAEPTIVIDGRSGPCCGSVLDSCRRAGVDLAAFCASENTSTGGHCRACLVEVDGHPAPACTTEALPGMQVSTDSERLRQYRRELGELMVSESEVLVADVTGSRDEVASQLERWGVVGDRYPKLAQDRRIDDSHPYLRLSLDRCIKCRLCARACGEIQGQFVYAFANRGSATRLQWGAADFAASDCVSCGACVEICPTGAIDDVDRLRTIASQTRVRTTCSYCGVGCQLWVHVGDDRVQRIDGVQEAAANRGHLCLKGRYAHAFSRHPDRLREPLIRRQGELVPCSWDEAIEAVAEGFRTAVESGRGVGALSSSRCTNEENYLVQKWMRAGFSTHNVDCCARVCHAPTAAGMKRVFGTGAATNSLSDIERCDSILIAGSNPTEAHPVTGARVKQAVLRGASLVVIDPRRTELAELADVHLQLRPGTNVPLLNSLAFVLIDEDLVDQDYVDGRTEGWAEYREFVLESFSPEETAPLTGVHPRDVRRAARLYGEATRPLQIHGLGMTEHYQGSESVMLLCNLALLVGGVGRPGVGVNPLRGQNNVQGAADMGCQPDAVTGYGDPDDPLVRERFQQVWRRPLPRLPGLTLPGMYESIRSGDLGALYILGEDVVQSDPAVHVAGVLERLDLLVVQELFLSPTAALADVVLPGASFLEKEGTFTNGERRVQRVRAAIEPPGDARPDWRALVDLMAATGLPQTFDGPAEIMDEIAKVSPSYSGISYVRLDAAGADGLQWPVPGLDHPGTEALHVDTFASGRAKLQRIDYLPSPSLARHGGSQRPLRLVTGRVLEHYNCGSMTRRSENVRLVSTDQLQIHPEDARARGLEDGAKVAVESAFGVASATAVISDRVAPGTVFLSFHFPETRTNQVTTDVLDRLADCPEYKLTPVEVRAEGLV